MKVVFHVFAKKLVAEQQQQKNKVYQANFLLLIDKSILKYLDIIQAIFSIDIPQDQCENKYLILQESLLNQYIIPIFSDTFSIESPKIHKYLEKMILTLKELCYEQLQLQKVINELPILNKIFCFIKSNEGTITLKKRSLNFLAEMIKNSFGNQYRSLNEISDIINDNNVMEILARTIGQYQDNQLNENLLLALQEWLESEVCENSQENYLWNQFCQFEGQKTLDKVIQNEKPFTQPYNIATHILDEFDKE